MAVTVPRYTLADLDDFPDDGNRYELLDGQLLVTPGPGVPHQSIAARLLVTLSIALEVPRVAHIFAPGAVVRFPATQLEPDVLVVPARFPLTSEWRDITEHWLAVEVLSRSSRVYDRRFKRDAYFALGVEQVWLVERWEQTVEVCERAGPGRIVRDVINWQVPTHAIAVTVDLGALFAGLR